MKSLSHVRLCNPMDSSLHQAPTSIGFSQQEHWGGLPFPFPKALAQIPGSCPLSFSAFLLSPPHFESVGKPRVVTWTKGDTSHSKVKVTDSSLPAPEDPPCCQPPPPTSAAGDTATHILTLSCKVSRQ